VLVRLTASGKATVDAAFESLVERERDLLSALPAKDRKQLAGLLRTLLSPFA
jgi:DNA-binding MarR family transcriptional regulator